MTTQPPGDPANALFDAIDDSNAAAIHSLLTQHPDLLSAVDWYHKHLPLQHAAYWDKPEIAKLLLAHGADVNARDPRGRTPLHTRSVPGTGDVVQLLLAHGADPNARDDEGITPIFSATSRRIAELLVTHGAAVDVTIPAPKKRRRGFYSRKGVTPLHAAVSRNAALVEYLLSVGCNPNARTADRNAPLHLVAGDDRVNIMKALLEHGANPNLHGRLGDTPLRRALFDSDIQRVDLLLKFGATETRNGDTLLHEARDPEMAAYLLARGENVNAINNRGETPLNAVFIYGIPEDEPALRALAEFLLQTGADPDRPDNDAMAPLHNLIANRLPLTLAAPLLQHGARLDPFILAATDNLDRFAERAAADPNVLHLRDKTGRSLLHWTAYTANIPAAQFLLARNADVNARNAEGQTPLHLAADGGGGGHFPFAELLLQHGANPNLTDNNQSTPLFNATWNDDPAMLTLLHRFGADLNHPDKDGCTPLHSAIWLNSHQAVAALLALHADVNRLTPKRKSPLDYALRERQSETIALLRSHGAKKGRDLPPPAQ